MVVSKSTKTNDERSVKYSWQFNTYRMYCALIIALIAFILSNKTLAVEWIPIDNFERAEDSMLDASWYVRDVQNETLPFVANPQVAIVKQEAQKQNKYYLKQAAPKGIVGNRKALSYILLPEAVAIGTNFTFYTRFMVESFPNNHSFGLSNMTPKQIDELSYNAFEPMLRITDKYESDGSKNSGALMVIATSHNGKASYSEIDGPEKDKPAKPLSPGAWYELWYVINNAKQADGGQSYDVYINGGEFEQQTLVFKDASFRMKRESDLLYFITIANTGPHKQPYGNGGLAYDDIYMSQGLNLSRPTL